MGPFGDRVVPLQAGRGKSAGTFFREEEENFHEEQE
jgi:hypothetical protein